MVINNAPDVMEKEHFLCAGGHFPRLATPPSPGGYVVDSFGVALVIRLMFCFTLITSDEMRFLCPGKTGLSGRFPW